MNNQITKISFDEWLETFKPVHNHFDRYASFQDDSGLGIMFETFGIELDFVRSRDPLKVWTYMDSEDGGTVIVDGYHLVNRIGYFITEVTRENKDDLYQITVSEDN
jgi:hypothetical protein